MIEKRKQAKSIEPAEEVGEVKEIVEEIVAENADESNHSKEE